MGLFNDVFGHDGFIGKLGETLQDTGWTLAAPVATAIDIARSGLDNNPDTTFGKALTTGINRGTQLFLGDNNGTPDTKADDKQNLISPGVNTVMDGLEWVYDNAIAQPINAANITEQRLIAGATGTEDNAHPWDLASAWKRGDEKTGGYSGQGTSIGRESANTWDALIGLFTGSRSSLTDEGQKQLNEHSKLFDVQSGSADFASRLFLDPTIVGGKAAKALKFATFIRGVKDTSQLTKMLHEDSAVGGLLSTFGERTKAAVDFNMGVDIGKARPAAEIYMANRGLQSAGGDGWQIAQALEQASKDLWKSGASVDEIQKTGRLIHLAGLNDPVALKNIPEKAAAAKDAMAAFRSQRDDLRLARDYASGKAGDRWARQTAEDVAGHHGLMDSVLAMGEDYLQSDEFLNLTRERLKAVGVSMTAAKQEAARMDKIQRLFSGEDSMAGSLTDYPLLAGIRGGTDAMAKRAAKEGGRTPERWKYNPARLDFVFQSSAWNKAVKLKVPQVFVPHIYYGAKAVTAFKQTQAPRVIDMHDENSPLALNNFLKHSAVTPEVREGLVGQMAAARTEGAKSNVVNDAIMHAQSSLIEKYAAAHPHFSTETAKAVIAKQSQQIQWEANRLKLQTRKFTAHMADDGTPGDVTFDDVTGTALYRPLLETQLENHIVLPDLRKFTKILDKHSGWLNDMAEWAQGNRLPDPNRVKEVAAKVFDKAVDARPGLDVRTSQRALSMMEKRWRVSEFTDGALAALQKGWKYGVLLRPAYPMRVLVDSDLRALAKMGPASFAMHFSPRAFGFMSMGSASRMKTAFAAHADGVRLKVLQDEMHQFEDRWAATSPLNDAGHPPQITDEQYLQNKTDAADIEKRLAQYRNGGRKGRSASYGRFGETGMRDIQTVAGTLPGAFADDYGKQMRYNASSRTTANLLGDQEKLTMGALMSENHVVIPNDAGNHMESWLHAVNAQIKQSELGKAAMRFQAGAGDNPEMAVNQLRQWLKTDPAGKQIQERMAWDTADADRFSREVVGMINHYIPTPELREKALKGRLTQADLETAYPDQAMRPPVHGTSLSRAMGRGSIAGGMINDWFSRTMRWLSDAPEDQLARHPLYAAVYEQEAKRQAEFLLADPEVDTLSGSEIQRRVQVRAHKKAQRAVKDTMFDIASQSDLSHALRFYSPFIAAWEDTVRKWGKLAMDDPSIVGKGYALWNVPNSMGLVVDKNGQPLKDEQGNAKRDDFTSDTYMLLQAPSWVPAVGGKELSIAGSHFRIPKQAMNIVLQGGLQPGFGPLVAIPTAKLQIANPELNDVARFINPYGPPESVWDAVAPSTVKRIGELMNDQSRAHMYDTERIYMQMLGEYRTDPEKFHGKAPEWKDAADKAKWIGVLKVINNSSSPFPAIFDSKYKLYQDAYRDLQNKQRTDGHEQGWADEQFIKGYGTSFFPLVQSMSKNNAGVGSTGEAVNALKKYSSEVSKYGMESGQANKALIRLIVGPEGEGAYNQSAHRWEETRQISPGSGTPFRDVSKGQQAAADADAKLGWLKFRQFTNFIDAQANDQGLRTYSESPELTAQKKEFVARLGQDLPAWRVDYESMDPGKFTRNIEQLQTLANTDTFVNQPDRTDMAGVREYLRLRNALKQQLSDFGIGEGTQAAIPLKQAFTDEVMNIVGSNTQFSEFAFHTFLERDPLLEPLPKAPVPADQSVSTATRWGF